MPIIGEKETERIRANIECIMAIETLEYHNANYLAGDNKSRNENKRYLLLESIQMLGTTAREWG